MGIKHSLSPNLLYSRAEVIITDVVDLSFSPSWLRRVNKLTLERWSREDTGDYRDYRDYRVMTLELIRTPRGLIMIQTPNFHLLSLGHHIQEQSLAGTIAGPGGLVD